MKRNGKIECLRFIASIYVLMFHIDKYILMLPPRKIRDGISIAFFQHGSMGVEFFFLVSGYLMAKTAYKQVTSSNSPLCGRNFSSKSLDFLKRKYISIFPYHAVAFVFALVTYLIVRRLSSIECVKSVFLSIPSFLLIQMSGIRLTDPNHIEWYISTMLIGMAVLYPLCLKFYHSFTKYYAPLIAILLTGYMQATTHRLTGVSVWNGIAYKSVLRAIAELALGAFAFEVSKYLSSIEWKKTSRYLFSLVELLCFLVFSAYVFYYGSYNYEVIVLIILFALITIAFSGISAGSKCFDNRFIYYLGSLSLPIYLANLPAIYCTERFFMSYGSVGRLAVTTVMAVAFAYAIRILGNLLKKHIFQRKKEQ